MQFYARFLKGDFYSSTGVTLRTYDVTANEIHLEIDATSDQRFLIEFIGKGGRVLTTASGHAAR